MNLSFMIALVIVAALGIPTIHILQKMGAGQRVRDDGPQRHLNKEGTPTMGGVLIVGAAVIGMMVGLLSMGRGFDWRFVALPASMLVYASIGAADDWFKIVRGRSLGLKARHKMALQIVAAIAIVYATSAIAVLVMMEATASDRPIASPSMAMPTLGWSLFWVLVIVFTSNAVNLADGLDGLAAGLVFIAAAGFGIIGWVRGVAELAIAGGAISGACLGFLIYNRHPARVFMGDVGSLALGGILGAMGMWTGEWLLVVGLCLVPYLEAGSVIAQVISYKATGKRIFKMSPLHHHFELSGWRETRVVGAFWAIALLAATISVGMAVIR